MADQAETPDTDEELLLTDEVEQEPEDEQRSDEDEADTNVNDQDDDEEVLTFGDDATDDKPDDTGLVKHLRDELKKARKEAAEARRSAPQEQPVDIGEKPTLMGCEYDEDEYEKQLDAWKDRKAEAEKRETQRTQASEDEMRAWQQEIETVNAEIVALNRSDAEEARETVKAALTDAQQAAIVQAADKGNRGKLIYALAKNPERLTQLAGEQNLVRFIKQVAQLEGQLKVVKRRKAPEPDVPQRGSGRIAAVPADKQLKKLEDEAERTGERTKLVEYKRKLKLKATEKKA